MKPVHATEEEKAEINAHVKESGKSGNTVEFERWKVVQSVICQGFTRRDAAKAFHRNRAFAETWVAAFLNGGPESLKKKPYPGKGKKLPDAQREELRIILEEGAEAAGFESNVWTSPRVKKLIQQRFGVKYDVSHVRRILHELGFSVQYPRQKLSKADHRAQEDWQTETLPSIKKKRRKRVEL